MATFTEFYCNASTGSNLNGGSGESGVITSLGATYERDTGAGALDRIVASAGTPFASVAVGQFTGVRAAGGGSPADFVCRVTAVNGGGASIDVSDAAASGVRPAHLASVDARVGGPWKGPNAAEDFPLDFVTNVLTNAAVDRPRINLKNNATYSITAQMTPNQNGPIRVEGYATTAGDGGVATIDGGVGGAGYVLLNGGSSMDAWFLAHLLFQNNGGSGTTAGIGLASVNAAQLYRVKVQNTRGPAIVLGTDAYLLECEFTGYQQAGAVDGSGVEGNLRRGVLERCYIHDAAIQAAGRVHGVNTGTSGVMELIECVFYQASIIALGNNLQVGGGSRVAVKNCDFLGSPGGSNVNLAMVGGLVGAFTMENSNLFNAARYGVEASGTDRWSISMRKNGFGRGSGANTLGDTFGLPTYADIIDHFAYPDNVFPWVDWTIGDFTLNNSASINQGRGKFYPGLVFEGRPDVGAVYAPAGVPVSGTKTLRFIGYQNGAVVIFGDTPVVGNPTQTYGVIDIDTNEVVIVAGSSFTHNGSGGYSMTFGSVENHVYRYYASVIHDGKTWYLPATTAYVDSVALVIGRYTDSQQIEQQFGVDNLHKWLGIDEKDEPVDYASRLYQFIFNAESEIDDALRDGGSVVPFTTTIPDLIRRVATALAGVRAYEARGVVDVDPTTNRAIHRLRFQQQWAMDNLTRIRGGCLRLTTDDAIRYPTIPIDDLEDEETEDVTYTS